jgi:spore coat polysaccharide biosynthesis protein SpsF
MAAGQQNNPRIGAIIQARMKSTRLPGKIILPLPIDSIDPLISWPIRRLQESLLIKHIILATSRNPENSKLKDIAEENKILFFQGDEDNVLSRFVGAATKHKLDVVVRITGDNPIIDEKLIDELLRLHLDGKFDYSYSVNLPLGMNIEIVESAVLLEISKRDDLKNVDKEHVTYYIKKTGLFKILKHEFNLKGYGNIRLTVDYPSDFAMLSLIASIANKESIFGTALIDFIINNYKWVFEVNSHLHQKGQYESLEHELPDSIRMLNLQEFNFTAAFLQSKQALGNV